MSASPIVGSQSDRVRAEFARGACADRSSEARGALEKLMSSTRCLSLSVLAIAGLAATSGSVSGQTYPTRPITMIVPFAAGGPTDTLARIVAERMKSALGHPIVIENVTGAG